jgi:hypothetical protein
LLNAYADVLDSHGCQTSRVLLPSRRSSPIKLVLAHFGESYVICESLVAKEIAN